MCCEAVRGKVVTWLTLPGGVDGSVAPPAMKLPSEEYLSTAKITMNGTTPPGRSRASKGPRQNLRSVQRPPRSPYRSWMGAIVPTPF